MKPMIKLEVVKNDKTFYESTVIDSVRDHSRAAGSGATAAISRHLSIGAADNSAPGD